MQDTSSTTRGRRQPLFLLINEPHELGILILSLTLPSAFVILHLRLG